MTDWAAALTYYGILAIFPALLVLVSILGLIGDSATQALIDNLGSVAPGPAKEIFTSAIENLQGSSGAAGIFFIIGLAGALWSASGYVAAFMRASNSIYGMEEGRPVWKTLPTRVGLTVVLLGAEFNAEIERGRAIEAGMPEEREPFVEPRDTRKMSESEQGVTPLPD